MPCRALLILLATFGCASTAWAEVSSGVFHYDARMAWLKAGELQLNLNRFGQQYEVAGEFQTSRAMSNYYSWNGVFAATGRWEGRGPVTTAYLSRTVSKDEDLKIVLNTEDGARLLKGPDADFENIEKPAGIDLISALFFSPGCFQGGTVHDGEDAYQLELRHQKAHKLTGGKNYYQGEVINCHYNVRDHKDRKRQVVVSLAEVGNTTVAVQVRAKIPVLPDAVFKLKLPVQTAPKPVLPALLAGGR